jgi:hypothetical protein
VTDNTPRNDARAKDEQIIARAQKRLKKAYLRLPSWRMVAQEYGVNVSYIFRLCEYGMVPRNPDIRFRLGLPRVLPSERKRRPKREPVKIGTEGWEEVYFKKVTK